MALTGKQKAAMLLMSLDSSTASELLKGMDIEVIQEIAIELALQDASGQRNTKQETKIAHEFFRSLQKEGQSQRTNIKSFLNETLLAIVGKDKAEQIQSKIEKVTEKKDLFAAIRLAGTDELVFALKGEHPEMVAMVLTELTPVKSQEVLPLLGEEVRLKAVCKMTNPKPLGAGVKQRIISVVNEKLKGFEGETLVKRPKRREQTLRKLAIVLSGLEKELRDQFLDEIKKHDEETATTVRKLMVTWEDIPSIADRSLQEALRAVEPAKLAIALYEADEDIVKRIRTIVSERVADMLDEEKSLMQEPLENEVLDAREEIVRPLREANEEGKLRFVRR